VACRMLADLECPVPDGEDRYKEAEHFINAMETDYHDPRKFRFALNAFLASARAVQTLLQKDLEKRGDVKWWNQRKTPQSLDPLLQTLSLSRNATLHQASVYDGSRVAVGLFRGRRWKLGMGADLAHDRTSHSLLLEWQRSELATMFLDDERSDLGEQYGVLRQYFIESLSTDEDVLRTCRRIFIKIDALLSAAHEIVNAPFPGIDEEIAVSDDSILKVTVLLESDVDPTLPKKWGWV